MLLPDRPVRQARPLFFIEHSHGGVSAIAPPGHSTKLNIQNCLPAMWDKQPWMPGCDSRHIKEIMMNASLNEVMLHIDEVLDEDSLHSLEEGIRQDVGSLVDTILKNPTMIMVVYDSDSTRASSLLHSFQERGLHAQVVGM
jgi:hypothetical protein